MGCLGRLAVNSRGPPQGTPTAIRNTTTWMAANIHAEQVRDGALDPSQPSFRPGKAVCCLWGLDAHMIKSAAATEAYGRIILAATKSKRKF